MADVKKPAASKRIDDVSHPDKTAPILTSKPVIVTNRPILKDPMMADEAPAAEPQEATAGEAAKPVGKPKAEHETAPDTPETSHTVAPLKATEKATEKSADKPAEETESDDKTEPKPETDPTKSEPAKKADDETSDDEAALQTEAEIDAEADAKAKKLAAVQKLVDGKQYFLPINSVEKRKTKRFVVLGIVLSLVLAVAWIDIALDAGLIQLGSVKPVTHFFSN